jgi:hypothetical protein
MKPWERYSFNIAALVVTLTGIAYFWMKYGLTSNDPFAVINHPWQPHMLSVHVVAAPVLLVLFGIVFSSHIRAKLRSCRPNRRTGLTALTTFVLMAISGYGLQVITGPLLKQICLGLHLATGVAFAVSYGTHLIVGLRLEADARIRREERMTA